jgi:hypothetical protein
VEAQQRLPVLREAGSVRFLDDFLFLSLSEAFRGARVRFSNALFSFTETKEEAKKRKVFLEGHRGVKKRPLFSSFDFIAN